MSFSSPLILYQLLLVITALVAVVVVAAAQNDDELTLNTCRKQFRWRREDGGGFGEFPKSRVKQQLRPDDMRHLIGFTGLTENEIYLRLQRIGRFHFVGEHKFWNPQSETESTWFYRTSVDYLFSNLWHDQTNALGRLVPENGPVLDFSGGTGNNNIYLAKKKIKSMYMGIGLIEYGFAEYRISELGLNEWVTFLKPYGPQTNWMLNSALALPRDGSLGTILAFDVLEHIHKYEVVVAAMVESLRPGGCIYESSPFEEEQENINITGTIRVHRSNGGVSMKTAMGPLMKIKYSRKKIFNPHNVWCKIKQPN